MKKRLKLTGDQVRYLVAILSGAGAVAFFLWMLFGQYAAIDAQSQNYNTLLSRYEELYAQAITEGVEPEVPAPDDVPTEKVDIPALPVTEPIPGPSGSTGAMGARGPGPTQDQVISALATYCSANNCKPAPTVAQVAAAISDYCAEGACVGKDGKDGKDGENGEDGEHGQDAPPVTADQVAAAVVTYCSDGTCRGAPGTDGKDATIEDIRAEVKNYCDANNLCRGPVGDTGKTGDTGPQGVGFKGVECPDDDNDDWQFTLTNDTVITVPGPCRVTTIIPPEPEPTPTE